MLLTFIFLCILIYNYETQAHAYFHKNEPVRKMWRDPSDPRRNPDYQPISGLSTDRNAYYNYISDLPRNQPPYQRLFA